MDGNEAILLITNIRKLIANKYPSLRVFTSSDEPYGDIMISLNNRDVYYSDEYQELVTRINIDFLWPKNITNVIFVYDESTEYCSTIIVRETDSVLMNANKWETTSTNQIKVFTDWTDPSFRKAA